MKVESVNGDKADDVLIPLIASDLAALWLSSHWDDKRALPTQTDNVIAALCLAHARKFGKAAGKAVQALFEEWSAGKDEATVGMVEKRLEVLSHKAERLGEVDEEFLRDRAERAWREVKLRRLLEESKSELDAGRLEEAEQKVSVGTDSSQDLDIDLFQDKEFSKAVHRKKGKGLITYPGELGYFFAGHLERDGFITFLGPEKSGKSWWLLDVAWRALEQGNRVVYFQVGDLSKHQIGERFHVRAARHPSRSSDGRWPVKVRIPREVVPPPVQTRGSKFPPATVERFDYKSFLAPLTWLTGWKALRAKQLKIAPPDEVRFKLRVYPNQTVSVANVKAALTEWERKGWTPDVVVIDYADILLHPKGFSEPRDAVNDTWSRLRGLSQERHCLVVTATQTNREGYNEYVLSPENVSEDKRKLSHITGMVGINCTPEEKGFGAGRLNWVSLRGGEYSWEKCWSYAGCLALARPLVCSSL